MWDNSDTWLRIRFMGGSNKGCWWVLCNQENCKNNDTRLVNYNCDKEQYTPENIYKEKGNILITPTDKDYLYFGANLRGGAKEALNILLNLNFFS